MDRNRFISLLLAILGLIIVIVSSVMKGEEDIMLYCFVMGIALLSTLVMIWFPDEIGGFTGFGGVMRPGITKTTPGCMIGGGGWALLIFLLIIIIKIALENGT